MIFLWRIASRVGQFCLRAQFYSRSRAEFCRRRKSLRAALLGMLLVVSLSDAGAPVALAEEIGTAAGRASSTPLSHAPHGVQPDIVHEGLALRLVDVSNRVEIAVTGGNVANARLFSLGSPNRVVLDIPGTKFISGGSVSPAINPLIGSVRFGVHPDKARIVLDILAPEIPPTTLRTERGDAIVISLPVAPEIRALFEATQASRAALASPGVRSEPENGAGQSANTSPLGPLASLSANGTRNGEPAIGEPERSPTDVSQYLSGIVFETLNDGTSAVRLLLNQRPAYSFQKNDKQTYRFTIKKCTLSGEELALPFYPPDDSRGLTVINPRQNGEDVEIFVGVSPGFRISSTSSQTGITIRAQTTP